MKKFGISLILLGVFALTVGAAPTPQETRDFAVAKRTFQDGLYDVAVQKIRQFQKDYPKSDSADELRWLLGQAFYFQDQYDEALKVFSKPAADNAAQPLKAGYVFWEAETLAALRKWTESSAKYRAFIDGYAQDERVPLAKLGLFNTQFHLGQQDDALKNLRELQALGAKNPIGQQAVLLRAKILLSQNKTDEAKELLNQVLAQNPKPPVLFDVAYWLGVSALNEKKADPALDYFRRITGDQRASPRNLVAEAWIGTGDALNLKKNFESATSAFEKAYTITTDDSTKQVAMQHFIEAHKSNKTLSTGMLQLREYVNKTGESGAVGLYIIAQSFYDAQNFDAAVTELDNLTRTYPNSEWAIEAYFLMGEVLAQKGEVAGAVQSFKKLIASNKKPNRSRDAQFRLAEIYFKSAQYAQAAEAYTLISKTGDNDPILERAIFNAVTSFSGTEKMDEFLKWSKIFAEKFPKSEQLKKITMEEARLYNLKGEGAKAREILKKFIAENKDPELVPLAIFRLGDSFKRDMDYDAAAEAFSKIEKEYATSDLYLPARYSRVLTQMRSGKLDPKIARSEFEDMVNKYPNHNLAPQIQFQIGETFYSQQDFGGAQAAFMRFVELYPKNPLVDDALYFAGKSLFWMLNYDGAISIFEKIKEESPLKVDSRLAEIDCYRTLGNFDAALKIANSLTTKEAKDVKDSAQQVLINLQKARLLYTLGGKEAKYYPDALLAADLVIKSSFANIEQRNEAGYIKGKCLEKADRKVDALQAYLDVIYNKLIPDNQVPQQPENRWFVKCGTEAATIRENDQDYKGAISIYRILEKVASPEREQFRKKIDELRTRYFIYEDK